MSIEYNQNYNTVPKFDYSTFVPMYTYTTNTTATSTNYTFTYQPFTNNFIYTDDFAMYFTDSLDGLASYIFSESSRKYIYEVLEDMADDYELQDFQDNLYRIVLNLLYEISCEEYYFPSFFDENKYPYSKMNNFIQDIINDFNEKFLAEEL